MSDQSDAVDSNIGKDADDHDDRDDVVVLDQDEGGGVGYMDTHNDVYAEEVYADLPIQSPSFQVRVFDPGSLEHACTSEYSAETAEITVHEWSGDTQELPAIKEEEPTTEGTTEHVPTYMQRRSSDTGLQFPNSSGGHGMRRVSTMTDCHRLKGRHKSPRLVAFKADAASPVITAISVRPAEECQIASMYQDGTKLPFESEAPSRRTAQAMQSDHGISKVVWEELSSSSDSDITVLTGTGIDYTIIDELAGDNASPSPMERLKTKLRAWSWEREMSEASADNRSRFVPVLDAEERSHARQSSDYLENPLGPPNTVRHSGQSSTIHSDPQTPADSEALEGGQDDFTLGQTAMFPEVSESDSQPEVRLLPPTTSARYVARTAFLLLQACSKGTSLNFHIATRSIYHMHAWTGMRSRRRGIRNSS